MKKLFLLLTVVALAGCDPNAPIGYEPAGQKAKRQIVKPYSARYALRVEYLEGSLDECPTYLCTIIDKTNEVSATYLIISGTTAIPLRSDSITHLAPINGESNE